MGPFRDKPGDLAPLYAGMIRQAGASVDRVVRVLPPLDTGGETEVLFLTSDKVPLTAHIADAQGAGGVLISSGW